MYLEIEVFKAAEADDSNYIASCSDLEIFSYGTTAAQAISRLEKIIKFYMTEAPEYGITPKKIAALGVTRKKYPEYYIPGRDSQGFMN